MCKALGLVHPDDARRLKGGVAYVGSFVPARLPEAVESFTSEWLKAKQAEFWENAAAPGASDMRFPRLPRGGEGYRVLVGRNQKDWESQTEQARVYSLAAYNWLFMTYRQYLDVLAKGVKEVGKLQVMPQYDEYTLKGSDGTRYKRKKMLSPGSFTLMYRPEEARYLEVVGDLDRHGKERLTPDTAGYLNYVEHVAPNAVAFLRRPIPALLPEQAQTHHAYVTGAIGSGKTELLKLLIHGAVSGGDSAVIVLDPHGDLAEQVARWPEFAQGDRLVYVDPSLEPDLSPCFNPFDAEIDPQRDGVAVQQFIAAFEDMLGEGGGSNLTVNMRSILLHCIPALFAMKGASLETLVSFMIQERNLSLVEKAARVLPGELGAFFKHELNRGHLEQSRLSIAQKVRSVLTPMRALFVGKSTVDLEQAVQQRKVIVFNLARGRLGPEASAAFGRFLLASILGLGLRRADRSIERVPVKVYVDECHNYMSATATAILEELRKYKVSLLLCQQQAGQQMDAGTRRSVVSNPRLLAAGSNGNDTYKVIQAETKAPPEMLAGLHDRQFLCWLRNVKKPFVVDAASHLADDTHAMSAANWQRVRADQIAKYYRPVGGGEPEPDDGGEAAKETDDSEDELKPKYEV